MARKAITKRIKMTPTGKFMFRRAGQNHFNAKMSRTAKRRQRHMAQFSPVMTRKMKAYL